MIEPADIDEDDELPEITPGRVAIINAGGFFVNVKCESLLYGMIRDCCGCDKVLPRILMVLVFNVSRFEDDVVAIPADEIADAAALDAFSV